MLKKTVTIVFFLLLVLMTIIPSALASSYNYARSTHPTPFHYNGYVQIKPSYNEGGKHAFQGYFIYTIPNVKSSGRKYTGTGTSQNDSRILSRSAAFLDSLDPNAPTTQFNYGFTWIPHNAPWPS